VEQVRAPIQDAVERKAKSSRGESWRHYRTMGGTRTLKVMMAYKRKRHAELSITHKFACTVSA
jgi:hypothetical protein